MQNTELKKSSFFNEISLEYNEIELPQDYIGDGEKSNLADRDP